MSGPIVYIDRSRIRTGKVVQVRDKAERLVDFIDGHEPQLLFYGFFIDESTSQMTVIAVHPDAASVELHMDVGREAFREFGDLIDMEGIEVYGQPSDRMLEQLESKARDLGESGSVTVGSLAAGFSRLPAHDQVDGQH